MSIKSEIRALKNEKEDLEEQVKVLKIKITSVVEIMQKIPSIENISRAFEKANLITTGYRKMLESIPDHAEAFVNIDKRTLSTLKDATRGLVKLKAMLK